MFALMSYLRDVKKGFKKMNLPRWWQPEKFQKFSDTKKGLLASFKFLSLKNQCKTKQDRYGPVSRLL
jgi:hypothetical protein